MDASARGPLHEGLLSGAPWPLELFLFLMSVHALATAIAVLKIGRFIFGKGHCDQKECLALGHPKEHRRFLGRIPYVGDLFYCTPCLAFWIGMAASAYVVSPARRVCPFWWQAMIMDGLAACAVSWILFLVAARLAQGVDGI